MKKQYKIKDVCFLSKGQQIDTDLLDDSKPYKYINGGLKESGYYDEYNTKANTVTVSEGGASCGYVNYLKEPFWCGCHCYRLENPKINAKYLYWALKASQHKIMDLRTGSAMPNIRKSLFENMTVLIDEDKNQQTIILNVLENIDGLINKHKQELSFYDELIKSRFNEMFGDVLQKSNGKKIKDACTSMVRGPFGSALKKEYFVPKGEKTYKVYEQKHAIQKDHTIGSYYVSEEKFNSLKRFEVRPGDIIMSCSGTIGEFYQLPSGCEKGLMNQALLKFTLNKNVINKTYFLHAMSLIIGDVDRSGTAIQNITSVSIIKETNLFIPNIDSQNAFALFVEKIDKLKFNI